MTPVEDCIKDNTCYFELFEGTDKNKISTNAKRRKVICRETGIPSEYIPDLYIKNWHKKGNKWYYFKAQDDSLSLINELIGEIISIHFGLDTANFKLSKLNIEGKKTKIGVASLNFFDRNYSYKRSYDYGLQEGYGLDVLENILGICFGIENYHLLVDDLKKLFIRDFYTSETDRVICNLFFKEGENEVRLAPLFDYESSFLFENPHGHYKNCIGRLYIDDPKTQKVLRDDEEFQKLLTILMTSRMANFIEETEDKHEILVPECIENHYKSHATKIKRLVRENNIIK